MQVSKKDLIFLSVSTRVYNPWTSFCLTVALGTGGGEGRYTSYRLTSRPGPCSVSAECGLRRGLHAIDT